MRALLLPAFLCLAATALSFPVFADPPELPPQSGDPSAPPPPPPPKPGQQPKWSPQEKLMSDLINASDSPRMALEHYYEQKHAWPNSLADMPGAVEKLPASIASVTLDPGGVVRVKFSAGAPGVGGKFAIYSPQLSSDGKSLDSWKCTTPDIAAKDSPCPGSH